MIHLTDSITISRSPADVFAFIADLTNIPKFQSDVVTSTVITPGPTKLGTRFTEDVKVGPMRTVASCEVTEFSPGRVMGFKAISPSIDYKGQFLVEPSAEGTRLTIAGTAEPKGWWKLIEPMIKGEFKGGIKHELKTLKNILEK
jgi:carbon monoxide dehydrogenase subunit G